MSLPRDKLGKMSDTKWHIGYVTKDPDDPRRDKRKCIYFRQGNCAYGGKCYSSVNCSKYKNPDDEKAVLYSSRKTVAKSMKPGNGKKKKKENREFAFRPVIKKP